MYKLEIKDLNKTFVSEKMNKVGAIKDLSFKVKEKEFLCVLGPSGCGKTTLLRIIAGLEKPSSGTIEWNKEKNDNYIGFVFQEHSLFPWRTVFNNIAFGHEMLRNPKDETKKVVDKLIELMSLKGFENSYPKELSGGMQKRVAIARALAVDPDILLMDEPFVSLDAQTRNNLQRELLKVWKEIKNTVIFVTHNVDEAVYLADRVLILTPRPTTLKTEFNINLPRPRDRTDPKFIKVRKEILSEMVFE
ncbi:MAG: ABC transporter ATP-binding protein [Candidatus Methanofastidiosia archaeon]